MILGKRRSVIVIECLILLIVWGPLFAIIAEDLISGRVKDLYGAG